MNLKRIYNRNRKSIWRGILIVATVIILIQALNYFAKRDSKNKNKNNNTISVSTQNKITTGNTTVINTNSSISGNSVSTDKLTTVANVINKFVENCNTGNIEGAYNLLTDECKEKLYPTINDFRRNYYNNTFNTSLTCEISNWTSDIYLVKLKEDALATGNISDEYIEEYITVKKTEKGYKLNISNYIGRTEINKTTTNKDISITIESKDTFMDYEEYNIVVKNNSDKAIMLDELNDTDKIYLEDSASVKYYSYSHEILEEDILVKSKYTKEFSIKFSNSYSSNRKIEKLVFSNVILDYDEYISLEQEYKDFYKFEAST